MHIMLDLETMGTRPNAPIIAIGAVSFDTDKIHDRFYRVVTLQSSVESGAVIDPDTVMWWMKQSDAARRDLVRQNKVCLRDALMGFKTWVSLVEHRNGPKTGMWGNGAAFDNVILNETYHRMDLKAPWSFRDDRCYRTVAAMSDVKGVDTGGTHHNAVDDAEWQAAHLMRIWAATN